MTGCRRRDGERKGGIASVYRKGELLLVLGRWIASRVRSGLQSRSSIVGGGRLLGQRCRGWLVGCAFDQVEALVKRDGRGECQVGETFLVGFWATWRAARFVGMWRGC